MSVAKNNAIYSNISFYFQKLQDEKAINIGRLYRSYLLEVIGQNFEDAKISCSSDKIKLESWIFTLWKIFGLENIFFERVQS